MIPRYDMHAAPGKRNARVGRLDVDTAKFYIPADNW